MIDEIKNFYLSKLDQLYSNLDFRKGVLSFQDHLNNSGAQEDSRESFKNIFNQYLEEASLTISLIEPLEKLDGKILLEVGSGLGLVYGFLKAKNYNIIGIEPATPGFGNCYQTALSLFRELSIDSSGLHPLSADEVSQLNIKFDLIFSNNVLEHILKLKDCLYELKSVLKSNGKMIHNTVNYLIPYEPHFKIFLVPLMPRLTEIFYPRLKGYLLWRDLNFITTHKLKKICRLIKLKICFDRLALLRTLLRFETDQEFAARQKFFFNLYWILKKMKLLKILKMIPVSLTTPITFTITNK